MGNRIPAMSRQQPDRAHGNRLARSPTRPASAGWRYASPSYGRILNINRAFTRITGYAAAETLGQQESRFRAGMQPASYYDDMYAAVRDADDRVTHYVTLFGELESLGADRAGVDRADMDRAHVD